ncbi:hypothetical protein [Marilutibacter alkalisoli]|uniref:Uncharacterized protein n=1 Tax=Marilutibacter alkalisoli TaxID=2591633 RepID=A0A514BTY1_9GAMM|nr:hypothetical protein [Lysobacter alkalisoli]QDH70871.1 hypothetical protein FKV23_12835 [Lysobacter alkalisoli]
MSAVLETLHEMRRQLPLGSQDPITFLRKANPLAERADSAIATVADLIAFNQKAGPIASAIVGARTQAEEIAACKAMAKLYNDDLDAALAGGEGGAAPKLSAFARAFVENIDEWDGEPAPGTRWHKEYAAAKALIAQNEGGAA